MCNFRLQWNNIEFVTAAKKFGLCTLSQKIVPPLTCYNLYIHGLIATIFSTNVAEKVGSQNVLIFPPHLTSAIALPGETGNPEIVCIHSNSAYFFTKNTKHS